MLKALAAGLLAVAFIALPSTASATILNTQVCNGLSSGKIDVQGDVKSVTITAPEGYYILSYCVKAGSTKQGNGPVYVEVDPPVNSITITHPSGKDISHYSAEWDEGLVTETPTPTPSDSETPTPSETPTTDKPTPSDTPTTDKPEPSDKPTPDKSDKPDKPTPDKPDTKTPEELPHTGAAWFYAAIALTLLVIGGGLTLAATRKV